MYVHGSKVKSPTASVKTDKHPKELSSAELRQVDRELDRLISVRLAQVQTIQTATATIEKAENSGAMICEVVLHANAVEKLSRSSLKDKVVILALDEFHIRFRRFLKSTSVVANQIDEGEIRLAEIKATINDTPKRRYALRNRSRLPVSSISVTWKAFELTARREGSTWVM